MVRFHDGLLKSRPRNFGEEVVVHAGSRYYMDNTVGSSGSLENSMEGYSLISFYTLLYHDENVSKSSCIYILVGLVNPVILENQ